MIFADDFFPPEIDFTQFFEQQEKCIQNSNISANDGSMHTNYTNEYTSVLIFYFSLGPSTVQNQAFIESFNKDTAYAESSKKDTAYADITSHASDVNNIIMIPPVMPKQLPNLKRSNIPSSCIFTNLYFF